MTLKLFKKYPFYKVHPLLIDTVKLVFTRNLVRELHNPLFLKTHAKYS